MKVYALSDIGSYRELNEDSFYAPCEGESFCCVADGMGGHQAGEVASALAAQVFADKMRDLTHVPYERLRRAVFYANLAIYDKARTNPDMSGMGTTITGLLIENGEAHIAHVGDSRCYLLRNRVLMQLTTDHTLVEELILQGRLTPEAAKNHPERNVITRALGTAGGVETDILRVKVQKGDMFLLCTDGLSGSITEREMNETLNSRMKRETKAATLIERAVDNGSRDNITVLIVSIDEEDVL